MPFFHADHLFEQKHAVLEPKQHLLEAEKLHTVTINVHFQTKLMLIPRPTCCEKLPSRFYFTKNFCKKIGIVFLYILLRVMHETFKNLILARICQIMTTKI